MPGIAPGLLLRIVLPYLHVAYLPADGLGEGVGELYHARILVGCGDVLHEVLDILDESLARKFVGELRLVFRSHHDGGLDHRAAHLFRVRNAGYGAFHYGRMPHYGALHLEGTHAVAGGLDEVVVAALEPVVTVLVAPGHISRVIDAVVPRLAGEFGVAVVTQEQAYRALAVRADDYDTALAGFCGRSVRGEDVDVVCGGGFAHGAGARFNPGESAQRQGGLGLPERFVDPEARATVEFFEHRRVEGLSGGGDMLQRREVEAVEVFLYEEAVNRWRSAE